MFNVKHIIRTDFFSTSREIMLVLLPKDLVINKSILGQVIAMIKLSSLLICKLKTHQIGSYI